VKGIDYEFFAFVFQVELFQSDCIILGTDIFPKGTIEEETNKSSPASSDETTLISSTAAGQIPPENNYQIDPSRPRNRGRQRTYRVN